MYDKRRRCNEPRNTLYGSRKYSNNFLFFNEMLMDFLFLMKLYDIYNE